MTKKTIRKPKRGTDAKRKPGSRAAGLLAAIDEERILQLSNDLSENIASGTTKEWRALASANGYAAFCCEKKCQCKWQGFVLHQGIGWGEIPDPQTNIWRQWHDRECGGKLIALSPHNADISDGGGQ